MGLYYSAAVGQNLAKTISAPRFQTYVTAAGGDTAKAEELYVANMRLSGAALEALHIFEVVLRNAVDQQLRTWNASNGGTEAWATAPVPLLRGVLDASGKLAQAKEAARSALKRKRQPLHDDVLAQMSLGTWRYLMPSASDVAKQKLWDEALELAFPRLFEVQRHTLVEWISIVYDLRNRVAHFEPIYGRDLHGKRRAMKSVVNAISKDARDWFVETDRFSQEITAFYAQWPEHKGGKA